MATNKYISFNIAGNGGGSGSTGNATALMAQNNLPSSPELGEVVAIKNSLSAGTWTYNTEGCEAGQAIRAIFHNNTAYTGTEVKIAELPGDDDDFQSYYGYDNTSGTTYYSYVDEKLYANEDFEQDLNTLYEVCVWRMKNSDGVFEIGLYNYDDEEYIPFTISTITLYSPTSSEVGVYQYDGTNWGGIAGGGSVIELTKAQYEALVDKDPDILYVISDAEVVDLNDYALSTAVTAEISAATATKADKANVTARTAPYLPTWNTQGVITGATQYYNKNQGINGTNYSVVSSSNTNHPSIFAPTAAGTAGQILQSNGSGSPIWSTYKIVFCSQSEYDALTTPDPNSIYFIVSDL